MPPIPYTPPVGLAPPPDEAQVRAVAPELLTACKAALEQLEAIYAAHFTNAGEDPIVQQLREVIARAEG